MYQEISITPSEGDSTSAQVMWAKALAQVSVSSPVEAGSCSNSTGAGCFLATFLSIFGRSWHAFEVMDVLSCGAFQVRRPPKPPTFAPQPPRHGRRPSTSRVRTLRRSAWALPEKLTPAPQGLPRGRDPLALGCCARQGVLRAWQALWGGRTRSDRLPWTYKKVARLKGRGLCALGGDWEHEPIQHEKSDHDESTMTIQTPGKMGKETWRDMP